MKPQSAKAKGRRFQQKIAKILTDTFGLEPGDIESRAMGSQGEDLMLSPAARRKIPFSFECKKHKRFPIYNVYEQAVSNADGRIPCAVIEEDRAKPLVVLSFADFLKLIQK